MCMGLFTTHTMCVNGQTLVLSKEYNRERFDKKINRIRPDKGEISKLMTHIQIVRERGKLRKIKRKKAMWRV